MAPEVNDLTNVLDSPCRRPIRTDDDGVIILSSDDEEEQMPVRKRRRGVSARPDKAGTCRSTDNDVDSSSSDEEVIELSMKNSEPIFRPNMAMDNNLEDGEEGACLMVGSVGTNALADFPHSRENCVLAPMAKTWNGPENKKFCANCYCYVCDVPAKDCRSWKTHCNARHKNKKWQRYRQDVRKKTEALALTEAELTTVQSNILRLTETSGLTTTSSTGSCSQSTTTPTSGLLLATELTSTRPKERTTASTTKLSHPGLPTSMPTSNWATPTKLAYPYYTSAQYLQQVPLLAQHYPYYTVPYQYFQQAAAHQRELCRAIQSTSAVQMAPFPNMAPAQQQTYSYCPWPVGHPYHHAFACPNQGPHQRVAPRISENPLPVARRPNTRVPPHQSR